MHRIFESFSILSSVILFPILCIKEWFNMHWGVSEISLFLINSLGAIVAADFMSGLAHWLFDSYGNENTPILGKNFIHPFREHHSDSKAITRHDFIETNGNSAIALLLIIIIPTLSLWYSPLGAYFTPIVLVFPLVFQFSVLMTNQFHKWAHMDKQPFFVHLLQKMKFILCPKHHSLHHHAPFERHYCITTGWLNVFLERIAFFPKMEAWIWHLFKTRTSREQTMETIGLQRNTHADPKSLV